jgi:hypothetical protein
LGTTALTLDLLVKELRFQRVRETVRETVVMRPEPKKVCNKGTLTKPFMKTKGVSCRPSLQHQESQTDAKSLEKPVFVPVPVPIYVPMPVQMYSQPYPVPVPIPLPVPVPVFLPTTRKSAKGILKHMEKVYYLYPCYLHVFSHQ